MKYVLLSLLIFSLAFATTACDFGGSDHHHGALVGGNAPIELAGSGFKGPVSEGRIRVYRLNDDGSLGELLGEVETDEDGNFDFEFDDLEGLIYVTLTGGSYVDEYTGAIQDNTFMAAVMNADTDDLSDFGITPLTTVAAQVILERLANNAATNFGALDAEEILLFIRGQFQRIFGVADLTVNPRLLNADGDNDLSDPALYMALVIAGLSAQADDHDATSAQLMDALVQDLLDGELDGFDQFGNEIDLFFLYADWTAFIEDFMDEFAGSFSFEGDGLGDLEDLFVFTREEPSFGPQFALNNIAPTAATVAGGTTVTVDLSLIPASKDRKSLLGTIFDATNVSVWFNDAPATVLDWEEDYIAVTTPAGAAGPADLRITWYDIGEETEELYTLNAEDAFLYTNGGSAPAPVITGLSETFGPICGGTRLRIRGRNFTPGCAVVIDGEVYDPFEGEHRPGIFTLRSSSTIDVIVLDAEAPGAGDVSVLCDAGAATVENGFAWRDRNVTRGYGNASLFGYYSGSAFGQGMLNFIDFPLKSLNAPQGIENMESVETFVASMDAFFFDGNGHFEAEIGFDSSFLRNLNAEPGLDELLYLPLHDMPVDGTYLVRNDGSVLIRYNVPDLTKAGLLNWFFASFFIEYSPIIHFEGYLSPDAEAFVLTDNQRSTLMDASGETPLTAGAEIGLLVRADEDELDGEDFDGLSYVFGAISYETNSTNYNLPFKPELSLPENEIFDEDFFAAWQASFGRIDFTHDESDGTQFTMLLLGVQASTEGGAISTGEGAPIGVRYEGFVAPGINEDRPEFALVATRVSVYEFGGFLFLDEEVESLIGLGVLSDNRNLIAGITTGTNPFILKVEQEGFIPLGPGDFVERANSGMFAGFRQAPDESAGLAIGEEVYGNAYRGCELFRLGEGIGEDSNRFELIGDARQQIDFVSVGESRLTFNALEIVAQTYQADEDAWFRQPLLNGNDMRRPLPTPEEVLGIPGGYNISGLLFLPVVHSLEVPNEIGDVNFDEGSFDDTFPFNSISQWEYSLVDFETEEEIIFQVFGTFLAEAEGRYFVASRVNVLDGLAAESGLQFFIRR